MSRGGGRFDYYSHPIPPPEIIIPVLPLERIPLLSLPDKQHQEMLDYAKKCSQEPYFNAFEFAESFIIEVDLPGLSDKKAVDIEFTDSQTLLVKGTITRNARINGGSSVEAAETSFEQTFKLLHSIDRENASAKLAEGILTIVLPKAGKLKIEVK